MLHLGCGNQMLFDTSLDNIIQLKRLNSLRNAKGHNLLRQIDFRSVRRPAKALQYFQQQAVSLRRLKLHQSSIQDPENCPLKRQGVPCRNSLSLLPSQADIHITPIKRVGIDAKFSSNCSLETRLKLLAPLGISSFHSHVWAQQKDRTL